MFSWLNRLLDRKQPFVESIVAEEVHAEEVDAEFISFRELFSRDKMAVRTQVYDVMNESFGVYIEPDWSNHNCTYIFKILPDSCIENIPEEHRPEFISTVNYFSRYLYDKLGIAFLLKEFVDAGKPYNRNTRQELEYIIKEYMVMHERIMDEPLRITLGEAIIKAIEG